MSTNIENIEKGIRDLREALNDTEVDQEVVLLLSIKALSDSRPTPCWIKGTDGRVLYVNPAYTAEFGVHVDDYRGDKDGKHWGHAIAVAFALPRRDQQRTRRDRKPGGDCTHRPRAL